MISARNIVVCFIIPALAKIDDTIEIVPLRIAHGNCIKHLLCRLEVILIDERTRTGKFSSIRAGIRGALPAVTVTGLCTGSGCLGRTALFSQHFICFVDFNKLFVCKFLQICVRVFIRMILLNQFQIRCADLFL